MDRPMVAAQQAFLHHREALLPLSVKERFEYIHRHNLWSDTESVSGVGSTLAETATLRKEIPRLLGSLGARSLLDIPCGDFHWLSEFSNAAELVESYTGADIVGALVESNLRRFASPSRRFVRLDLLSDPLPYADVILCRDCLVHLSFANIRLALGNLQRSGGAWLLMTHFPQVLENREVEDGDWRPLNFELAPFELPSPKHTIVENCREGEGGYRDKSLGLWRLTDLRLF